jgi:glycine hydroxymethyltransferase
MVNNNAFFTETLSQADPVLFEEIQGELRRQQTQVELIASENIVSRAVLEAQGSILTNKYAEGYPGKRYYGGCEWVDQVEQLAIDRACELFKCSYANVQPHSGSQANQAVFLACLNPGDVILGMGINAGGHLTHGVKVNLSGKWFKATTYGVKEETHLIDYEEVHTQALTHRPKLIIAGGSAYPRTIDFARFRQIADEVGAILMVDMAHFAGLVAGGVFPSPLPHAHVVTTTTHKTLRGPRGGMILSNDLELGKKINSSIFPGLQGGPLMHVIAAKAVSFKEALQPNFATYAKNTIENAQALANIMIQRGLNVVTHGTDCHLILVDLRPFNITGAEAETKLEQAGLTCNKNSIPFDRLPPMQTSGIRLGSPAGTTRGFKQGEFEKIGHWIADVLEGDDSAIGLTRTKVEELCNHFPIYV